MSMDHSFAPTEWKPEASTGRQAQVGMPMLALVPAAAMVEERLLACVSFSGALNESMRAAAKEDWEVADAIHISHGYMSRFMKGVGQRWARRLVAFMHATNSRAPLQWIAHQVGCDVVPRTAREVRIRELEMALQHARGLS